MTDWYKDPQYVETIVTPLSEQLAAVCLQKAFSKIIGTAPKAISVAILWAQCALETGRFHKINNYNYGNIKKCHKPDDGKNFYMTATGENIWDVQNKVTKWQWFVPDHIQTHFVSNNSAEEGAEHYVNFLAKRIRYAKAWAQVIAGDPNKYNHELKVANYYTADEIIYGKGVFSLTNYFMKNVDKLLAPLSDEITINQPTELFSDEEKAHILSLVNLTNDMSIEDYFKNSNNDNAEEVA